ncbi:hypothetical protein ACHAXR_002044 [Thalassiosira sp. AJA248-18]
MCICKVTSKHLRQRVDPVSPKGIRKGKTIRRSVCANLPISTSFTLMIIALSRIVGSEHEQIKPPRAASNGGYNYFGPSLRRFFGGLYQSNDPQPLLTDDQVDSYTRDGFVVVSGLLDNGEMDSLVEAGEGLVSKHIEKSDGQLKNGNFQVHEFGLVLNDKRFRDVALHSRLPRAAAELLQLDSESQNLRVLRDVFLAKGHESTSSCGWHVDDQLFWPAAYKLPTSKIDQSGINAWIALDDMPIENGGSMAVSPSSHSPGFSWRSDAFVALNFDDKFGNGVSKDDLVEMIKSGKVDTCGLEKFAPDVYDDIELSKQEFSFRKGDIIFMNRWLFHKSTDVTEKGRSAMHALQSSSLLKRYSVRFATGSTSLPEGFVTEMSVMSSDGNLGQHLNDVSGEWYPQSWPNVDVDVDEKIDTLVQQELPRAQEKLGAIMAEVMSLFQSR